MEGLAFEGAELLGQGGAGLRWKSQAAAVDRVAHYGMVDVGHVDAYLVGAAGFQGEAQQGMGAQAAFHAVAGGGRSADRLWIASGRSHS